MENFNEILKGINEKVEKEKFEGFEEIFFRITELDKVKFELYDKLMNEIKDEKTKAEMNNILKKIIELGLELEKKANSPSLK